MRIVIGSDHAGYELKAGVISLLELLQHEPVDVGVFDTTPSDYPDAAEAVAQVLQSGGADRGILICGSGVGACVAANKVNGIRAGLCHDTYSAHQGVEHDDINVLVMGSRIVGSELARDIVRIYLNAKFTHEERHVRRLKKVASMEERFFQSPQERVLGQPVANTSVNLLNSLEFILPDELDTAVDQTVAEWQATQKMKRLWDRDATVWTGEDEEKWLGWLGIIADQLTNPEHLLKIAEEVRSGGFSHVLLLGMGGSSLGPEVMAITFGPVSGYPQLLVLDSTDPQQVKTFESKIDPKKTLFIVSSKSGTTLEPNIFQQYFFDVTKKAVGDQAGKHFIAITDPGSKMEKVAEEMGFRHIFYGLPSIGGRYSVLSDFGMVPAAAMGVDVVGFLSHAQQMAKACQATEQLEDNPGFMLGNILGNAAVKFGRDKVTILTSKEIHDFGAWMEQLIAESTGKIGKGLIPVDREHVASIDHYGNDRVFAYLRVKGKTDADQEAKVAALEQAGQPVIRIVLESPLHLGQEMFRWEIATAVAGSIIGINAFNQPDVEASKIETRKLTTEYEEKGSLPPESPIWSGDGVKLFTDEKNAAALAGADSLVTYLRKHLDRIGEGDYFAVLGYIEMNDEHEKLLQQLRHHVRDQRKVATCLGFGPRFLHSTGQAYKGGPNSGVFLQITCDDAVELPVPGAKYTFGVVKSAQARGDFQVLADRGRRALRVHLGKDVNAGLQQLIAAL